MCVVQLTKNQNMCDCGERLLSSNNSARRRGQKIRCKNVFLTPSMGSSDLSTYNMWLHLFLRFSKDWKFPLLQSRIISQLFSLGKVLCVSKLLAENILFQDVKNCFNGSWCDFLWEHERQTGLVQKQNCTVLCKQERCKNSPRWQCWTAVDKAPRLSRLNTRVNPRHTISIWKKCQKCPLAFPEAFWFE